MSNILDRLNKYSKDKNVDDESYRKRNLAGEVSDQEQNVRMRDLVKNVGIPAGTVTTKLAAMSPEIENVLASKNANAAARGIEAVGEKLINARDKGAEWIKSNISSDQLRELLRAGNMKIDTLGKEIVKRTQGL